jgi:hypothetical protein
MGISTRQQQIVECDLSRCLSLKAELVLNMASRA